MLPKGAARSERVTKRLAQITFKEFTLSKAAKYGIKKRPTAWRLLDVGMWFIVVDTIYIV